MTPEASARAMREAALQSALREVKIQINHPDVPDHLRTYIVSVVNRALALPLPTPEAREDGNMRCPGCGGNAQHDPVDAVGWFAHKPGCKYDPSPPARVAEGEQ